MLYSQILGVAAYVCPGYSLRHHLFPFLSLLQRLHVRVFYFIYRHIHSPPQLLLPYRSHIRGFHTLCLSHASYPICGLDSFVTNRRERVGTKGQDPVADSTLLLALPSNQTIFHVHSQVECPTVHDRATRRVTFFTSVLPSLILLRSGFRCRHHHTVLWSPV